CQNRRWGRFHDLHTEGPGVASADRGFTDSQDNPEHSMRVWPVAVLTAASLTIASCQDPSAPVGPLQLSIVSGNVQSGLPGAELAQPLVVLVQDSKGKKIGSQIVNFREIGRAHV